MGKPRCLKLPADLIAAIEFLQRWKPGGPRKADLINGFDLAEMTAKNWESDPTSLGLGKRTAEKAYDKDAHKLQISSNGEMIGLNAGL